MIVDGEGMERELSVLRRIKRERDRQRAASSGHQLIEHVGKVARKMGVGVDEEIGEVGDLHVREGEDPLRQRMHGEVHF